MNSLAWHLSQAGEMLQLWSCSLKELNTDGAEKIGMPLLKNRCLFSYWQPKR